MPKLLVSKSTTTLTLNFLGSANTLNTSLEIMRTWIEENLDIYKVGSPQTW